MIVKVCKVCGSLNFKAQTIRGAIVTAELDENGNLVPSIISEDEALSNLSFMECANCGSPINDLSTDIVDATECAECNEFVKVEELNEEGKCPGCANPRPDLQGLSQAQLIRKIIELEKKINMQKQASKSGNETITEDFEAALDSGEII